MLGDSSIWSERSIIDELEGRLQLERSSYGGTLTLITLTDEIEIEDSDGSQRGERREPWVWLLVDEAGGSIEILWRHYSLGKLQVPPSDVFMTVYKLKPLEELSLPR